MNDSCVFLGRKFTGEASLSARLLARQYPVYGMKIAAQLSLVEVASSGDSGIVGTVEPR